MSFFQYKHIKEPEVTKELKKQESSLENLINKFRIFFVSFLIITDYILMFFLDKLDTFKVYDEIIGLLIVYGLFYYIHRITKKENYKPLLKYLTVILDYIIVLGCFHEGRDIIIQATNITIEQYLLLITTLIIVINIISALRIQLPIIIFSTVLGLIVNYYLLEYYNLKLIILIYSSLLIILSGFFNKYISSFIFRFFVTNYKLGITLNDLKDANNEIVNQNHELEAQNISLAEQRDKIAQQKKNITSSITYASRIQNAILNSEEEIKQVAPDSFVLFKPKDIVSGDFYWFKQIKVSSKKYNIFTAVDCTGHGVPGAFMSMLGISFLNDIIFDFLDELDLSQLLNRLRDEIKLHLRHKDSTKNVKDGMDMAICAVDYENMKLQFAGAYNSLYIVRNSNNKKELIEYKGDRMPIGIYYRNESPFTNQTIDVRNGDTIYLFTDGYVDQFGGKYGQKYKIQPFKDKLISICSLTMEEQKRELENELENWMGEIHHQIDDITIIGVKI